MRVQPVSPDSPDAVALITELDADIARRYPGVPIHGLTPVQLRASSIVFYVADVDGVAAGCGALRERDDGLLEVKRMFVRPAFRRQGVARALLAALEAAARDRGARRLVLETATGQPEAIALYRSSGYVPIPRFGEYCDIDASRCFEKTFVSRKP